jgi:hypothetical protein
MFRILAIAAALFGLASAAHADVWRWTDPNGTIHYSDNWVPGSVLVKTDSRNTYSAANAAAPATSTNGTSPPAAPADSAKASQDKRTVDADKAKSQADQCKQARDAYDKAVQSRRLYKQNANGEREYLSDADADAVRVKMLDARRQACGS